MSEDFESLTQTGMKHFQKKEYTLAADYFSRAAEVARSQGQELDEAEQKNNLSVSLLFGGNARQAYEAAAGTADVFQAHNDKKRQAMALGNAAQALEGLKDYPKAAELYGQATDLLKGENQGEIRSMLLHRKAGVEAKLGETFSSAASLAASIDEKPKPGMKDKLLKKVFDKIFHSNHD